MLRKPGARHPSTTTTTATTTTVSRGTISYL
jgi:hypothetical protein